MIKVSIIVPVYNVEKYLEECVNSLLCQTLEEIQLILVDDGSTDRSADMIDEYARLDSRVVALHKNNGGQSSARNLGSLYAQGEYVLYVDSDDYLIPNACEELYAVGKKYNADIVQGDLQNEQEKILTDSNYRRIPSENIRIGTRQFLIEKLETATYDIVPFLYFVKRDFLQRTGLSFPVGYAYEDQLYTFQLLTTKASIVKIRFPFYYYRMDRPGSTTNLIVLKRGQDAAYICKKMYNHYLELEPQDKMENAAVVLISLYQFYRVYLRLKANDRKQVWDCIDFSQILNDLPRGYYNHLRVELEHFVKYRKRVVFKYDFKKQLKRILRR